MSAPTPDPALLPALGRVVRGLSALFWALPLTLLTCANNMVADWLRSFGMAPPIVLTALLLFGVQQLGAFNPGERVWRLALERTRILAIVNVGLAPFLYWSHRVPGDEFLALGVALFFVSGILFLHNLNHALDRLAAMLPDETLRQDTRLFTRINRAVLGGLLFALSVIYGLLQIESLPGIVRLMLLTIDYERRWVFLFLLLLPVALTMTLLWKIKDTIFESVFHRAAPAADP
jgi:hypothetical protein